MKQKHADVIKAWADGADIQYKPFDSLSWFDQRPLSEMTNEYRIKPSAVVTYPADEQTDNHTGICLEVEA